MPENELSTGHKIFQAARHIFLFYGYHGTTLQKVASEAGVNKSAIHYYYRSKDRLYIKIVEYVLNSIFTSNSHFNTNQKGIENPKWFLYTELYNNEYLFTKVLKGLYPNNYEDVLEEIRKLIKFLYGHSLPDRI